MKTTYRGENLYSNNCFFSAAFAGIGLALTMVAMLLLVFMVKPWYLPVIAFMPIAALILVCMIREIKMYRHYNRVTLTDVQLVKPSAFWFNNRRWLSVGFEATKDGQVMSERSPGIFRYGFLKTSDYPNKPYRVGYDPEKKRWVIIKVVMDESDIE
ncbi:MAG: hypothetical protein IK055_10135 [Lachnospiraceae bacterium]|nr:hypothetical protein [Lachnospiraceae bacterium]